MKKTTHEEIREKIFDFVYLMALRDATMRKAYGGEVDDREEMKKRANKGNVKSIVKTYIDDILRGENDDSKTITVIKKVKDAVDDKNFTFGNAQKLINMTVKYFYISCYNDSKMREKFQCCHCPMDSIMIKKVRNLMNDEEKKKTNLKGDTSWSRINDDNTKHPIDAYNDFQRIIRDKKGISPIEFDYCAWND